MNGLFSFKAIEEYETSASHLLSLLESSRRELRTGVIQVSYPFNQLLIILLVQGEPINLYRSVENNLTKIQLEQIVPLMGTTQARACIQTLPLEGIRVSKMLIECPKSKGEFQLQTRDLNRRLDGWSASPETQAIRIQWPLAEAVLVFPGNNGPIQPILFLSESSIATEMDALAAIQNWNEPTCNISVFSGDNQAEAWIEYKLHLTFTNIVERLLTRYNELAGKSLVSVLNQEIDDETLRRGWRISCVGNGVLDHHVFPSPKEAAAAYRLLCKLILAHLQTVVGPKITRAIVRDMLEATGPQGREILETYRLLAAFKASLLSDGGENE